MVGSHAAIRFLERQRATSGHLRDDCRDLILYVIAPKGFLPLQDGLHTAVTEAVPTASFAEMQSRQTKAAEAIQADPVSPAFVSVIGAGSINPPPMSAAW
jgi:multidrug efflux pump